MENIIKKEFIILGGGPSGLQIAYFLEKKGCDYLVIEKNNVPGSFYEKFPRHDKLISINKLYTGSENEEFNLRFDWNSLLSDPDDPLLFKEFTEAYFPDRSALLLYLKKYVEKYNLKIDYNTEIVHVSKEEHFQLKSDTGVQYASKYLIIATGFSKQYIPDIKGIEMCESYSDYPVDPKGFINQSVLIIGTGNSGFEVADSLTPTASVINIVSPSPVKLAWKTHFVGHLRAVNNNFVDTYQLKSQNGILTANVVEIRKNSADEYEVDLNYSLSGEELVTYKYDRIIYCTGFQFDNSIFDNSCMPELCINDRFPDLKTNWESNNVSNMFFAGTITQSRDYKKGTSGFIHGFRYNCKTLFNFLMHRAFEIALPHIELAADIGIVTDFIIKRINETSALWQQFGFFADVMVKKNDKFIYYFELPLDYIDENLCNNNEDLIVISLEFGKKFFEEASDLFAMQRPKTTDVENAHKSAFLHPVFRRYVGKELHATKHLNENLESEWNYQETHIDTLHKFLEDCYHPVNVN